MDVHSPVGPGTLPSMRKEPFPALLFMGVSPRRCFLTAHIDVTIAGTLELRIGPDRLDADQVSLTRPVRRIRASKASIEDDAIG